MWVVALRHHEFTTRNAPALLLSSGACHGRRCRCHESPPCRSVLRASLCWRQAKTQWTQVGLHRSEPRLSGTARPSSPICRSVRSAGLQSSVVVLAWICSVEIAKEGQMMTPDSVWQQRLPSTGANLIIGNKLCPVDVEDALTAPVIQAVDLPRSCFCPIEIHQKDTCIVHCKGGTRFRARYWIAIYSDPVQTLLPELS